MGHGLRSAIERHKARLQSEFTKARIRRKLSTLDVLKNHVESGLDDSDEAGNAPLKYPRWIRINTLKSSLEDQLETTFAEFELVTDVALVRRAGTPRLYIDAHIPNLIAVNPNFDATKTEAYKKGCIILQDKASCFPAYLLDPVTTDGDIIDGCSAPGNKTTHLAAILRAHQYDEENSTQVVHAFERSKERAKTLEKMVNIAGSQGSTQLHPGEDFLRADPLSAMYAKVGALLLDPSCSGSGIVGRDDGPTLHIPAGAIAGKPATASSMLGKRKRDVPKKEAPVAAVLVDDDGEETTIDSESDLHSRLEKLSSFQLKLLLHALKFPSAHKVSYSTCSTHAEENEHVIRQALASDIAQQQGWRILARDEQIGGLRSWPVRGLVDACDGNEELAAACIRTNKGDAHGTMGFFVACFIRDKRLPDHIDAHLLRDERGRLVRNVMGVPVQAASKEEEWTGFDDSTEAIL